SSSIPADNVPAGSSSSIPADFVSAGHVLVSADRDRICRLAKFQWVLTHAKSLGIPPPPELSTFRVSITDKKRKRSSEILKEVFVNEDIVVDGMHRNLVPPPRVEGRRGLVIREPESGIFFYNGNFDLVF
ncbi:hypothetical protein Tco_1240116, partial [Tanacetum coccineum]